MPWLILFISSFPSFFFLLFCTSPNLFCLLPFFSPAHCFLPNSCGEKNLSLPVEKNDFFPGHHDTNALFLRLRFEIEAKQIREFFPLHVPYSNSDPFTGALFAPPLSPFFLPCVKNRLSFFLFRICVLFWSAANLLEPPFFPSRAQKMAPCYRLHP